MTTPAPEQSAALKTASATPIATPSKTFLAATARPIVFIVMGVSGCGKSTIADALAERLGYHRLEGDALHPPANIEKMSHGIPLTDEDRWPWLEKIATQIRTWVAAGEPGVITCSALKRAYRDVLSGGSHAVCFLYLKGTKEEILPRLSHRTGHFMPTSLLDSQFATLQEPTQDEMMVELHVMATCEDICDAFVETLNHLPA